MNFIDRMISSIASFRIFPEPLEPLESYICPKCGYGMLERGKKAMAKRVKEHNENDCDWHPKTQKGKEMKTVSKWMRCRKCNRLGHHAGQCFRKDNHERKD